MKRCPSSPIRRHYMAWSNVPQDYALPIVDFMQLETPWLNVLEHHGDRGAFGEWNGLPDDFNNVTFAMEGSFTATITAVTTNEVMTQSIQPGADDYSPEIVQFMHRVGIENSHWKIRIDSARAKWRCLYPRGGLEIVPPCTKRRVTQDTVEGPAMLAIASEGVREAVILEAGETMDFAPVSGSIYAVPLGKDNPVVTVIEPEGVA